MSALLQVLLLALAALLVSAVAAPLGTLRWWAGAGAGPASAPIARAARAEGRANGAAHFLVYVPGVDAYSEEWLSRRESLLLEGLAREVPGLAIVHDVFAYDIGRHGLGDHPLGAVWSWLHRQRLGHSPLGALSNLISLRNVLQVAISADPRYGPIYNFGVAQMLRAALLRHGYPAGSGRPVTLVGYSGGAQIALGAVTYLRSALGAPVRVVAIGGVLSCDPGLAHVQHLHYLYGSHDRLQQFAPLLFPGRLPVAVGSHWNRALAAGRITRVCIGPMRHTGRGAYFDRDGRLADGTSFLDATVASVARLLGGRAGPPGPPSEGPAAAPLIVLPDPALVVLVGPAGSGKSTFAARRFRPTEIVSSDSCRALVADDEGDMSATAAAFEVLHLVVGHRLRRRRLTVVDAVSARPADRRGLVALARESRCPAVAVVFDLPEELCVERDRRRPGRTVGARAIRAQRAQVLRSLGTLHEEGFEAVHLLDSAGAVEGAVVRRPPASHDSAPG